MEWHGIPEAPPTSIAVSDTLTTSYTVDEEAYGVSYRLFIAFGTAPSSGANTVTVDPEGSAYIAYSVDEFCGNHATPASVDGGTSTGTSDTPSDSISTATANELIIGLMAGNQLNAVTVTPDGAWTQIGESEDGSSSPIFSLIFRIVTTISSYSAAWTTSDPSGNWRAMTYSFKEAARRRSQVIIFP